MRAVLSPIDQSALAPLRNRTYATLREALMGGAFEPGELITVHSLAQTLQLGSTPVREAVQQLVAEGALQWLPSRKFRVPMMSRSELKELFAIRRLVESYAARRAAVRFTSADSGVLEQIQIELSAAHDAKNVRAGLNANRRFHFTIYKAADSAVLLSEIERLWVRVGPLLIKPFRVFDSSSLFKASEWLHWSLCRALHDHKPVAAEQLMRRVMATSYKWQLTHMNEGQLSSVVPTG